MESLGYHVWDVVGSAISNRLMDEAETAISSVAMGLILETHIVGTVTSGKIMAALELFNRQFRLNCRLLNGDTIAFRRADG